MLCVCGIFISHYNSERFTGENKSFTTETVYICSTDKAVFDDGSKITTVAGVVSSPSSQSDIFTFTPQGPLLPPTVYTVTIKKRESTTGENLFKSGTLLTIKAIQAEGTNVLSPNVDHALILSTNKSLIDNFVKIMRQSTDIFASNTQTDTIKSKSNDFAE